MKKTHKMKTFSIEYRQKSLKRIYSCYIGAKTSKKEYGNTSNLTRNTHNGEV